MIDNVKLIESSCWVLFLRARKCQVLEIFRFALTNILQSWVSIVYFVKCDLLCKFHKISFISSKSLTFEINNLYLSFTLISKYTWILKKVINVILCENEINEWQIKFHIVHCRLFYIKLKNRTLNSENMKFDLQLEIDSIGNEMKSTVLFSCILMKIKFKDVF